jgi:multidrug efflux pump
LSTVATIREKTVPRTLNRLKQLNAVTISGVSSLRLDQALKLLEGEAAKILPAGYSVDYTGESRQLRVEGDKFLPAFGLAVRPHFPRPRGAVLTAFAIRSSFMLARFHSPSSAR